MGAHDYLRRQATSHVYPTWKQETCTKPGHLVSRLLLRVSQVLHRNLQVIVMCSEQVRGMSPARSSIRHAAAPATGRASAAAPQRRGWGRTGPWMR